MIRRRASMEDGSSYNSDAHNGNGMRAHANPDLAGMVYAMKPSPTRRMPEQVNSGFARSWETIASMPRMQEIAFPRSDYKYMTIKLLISLVLISSSAFIGQAHAELKGGDQLKPCASNTDAKRIAKYFAGRPGAPTPKLSRDLGIPELHVVTGLPKESRVSVKSTPELVREIWSSIDAWGEQTAVHLVFTMGGAHVFDFPSLVPVRQKDINDGWLNVYANRGDGVHGHLWLDHITTVHAIDVPGSDDTRTRGVLFFLPKGDLAIGVYASNATKEFDPKAVDGFERTWELLKAKPQICK